MKLLTIKGTLAGNGKIGLETTKTINWSELTGQPIPDIPFKSSIELIISLDEDEFISGKNGMVWATFDIRQAEIIRNALMTLRINTEIGKIYSLESEMYLLKAINENDIGEAIDFIWRNESGLRLKPDWSYPKDEINKSFEQWLSGNN